MATSADDAPHGVSLARYAAVIAAVAEPFPLRKVLALEEIEPAAFRAAEVVWKKRIVKGAPGGGPVFARYCAELAGAEDWLVRRISPLYQEPSAWAAFLCAFAVHPADVLRVTGLGRNDFARLSRHWARLSAEDTALAGDVSDHLGRGLRELPRITAEPRELRRSRGYQAAPPASARAAREVSAAARQPPAPAPIAAPPAVVTPPPVSTPSFAIAAVPGIAAPAVIAAPASVRGTMEMPIARPGADLPFAPKSKPSHPTIAMPATGDGPASRPVLPFRPAGPPSSGAAAPRSSGAPAPPPSGAAEPALRLEQYASLCVELSLGPERSADILRRYRLSTTAKAALDKHYTKQLARDPALQASFVRAQAAYRAWLTQTAEPAPSSQASRPPLSLEQHASLSVDLTVDPGRRAETLLRYQLTEGQLEALEGARAALLARDPGKRAAFERACADYRATLARGRR